MNYDKDAELMAEAYLTQRIYSSKVPLSDGFLASLKKEYNQLRDEGYSVDRILKKIMFELKTMDSQPKEKETIEKTKKPITMGGADDVPKKELDTPMRPPQGEM